MPSTRAKRVLAEGDGTTFGELVVRPSAPIVAPRIDGDDAPFEIVLASGTVVRVPASFDGTALARLLDVVARAC